MSHPGNGAAESKAESTDLTAERFSGEILVSSRIIDQLSTNLYESPAACLKELINNSYDADATKVIVSVRPDADVIIINDNGTGMTPPEFRQHFSRIAESQKRDSGEMTALGRPKIGRIGIGFIAANEICDRMEIETTVTGSPDLLEVTIDFAKMRMDPSRRRREHQDLAKGDYVGRITPTALIDEHYTRVYLRDIRGKAQEILSGAQEGKRDNSLYGLKPETVRDLIASVTSWDEFDSYSRALLQIGLSTPVRYFDDWLPREYRKDVAPFTDRARKLDFDVIVDGTSLRKPVVLNPGPDGRSLLRVVQLRGEAVSGTGYMYAASGKLTPHDLNGVLIRIRDVAIGSYHRDFLGYPSWVSSLFQNWVSCELYTDDALEESMNIDRKSFRITDTAYVELQTLLHAELRSFLAEVREELYRKRSERRRYERAREQSRRLEDMRDRLSDSIGEEGAGLVIEGLTKPPSTKAPPEQRISSEEPSGGDEDKPLDVRALTTKYTAVQIVELAAKAAGEVGLGPSDTQRLLGEIARLLRGR